jgi:hypothetical protein
MAAKYARDLPQDKNNNVYPAPPAYISTQAQRGNPVASSVVTLNDKSTVIDIMAISGGTAAGGILGKWGAASVTATNFDFMVNAGQNRTFVVPQSVQGTASISGANVANGLYPTVAFISATAQACSVFTAEY